MQPIRSISTTLEGDYGDTKDIIIPVKFGQNPISGFRGEVKRLVRIALDMIEVETNFMLQIS